MSSEPSSPAEEIENALTRLGNIWIRPSWLRKPLQELLQDSLKEYLQHSRAGWQVSAQAVLDRIMPLVKEIDKPEWED